MGAFAGGFRLLFLMLAVVILVVAVSIFNGCQIGFTFECYERKQKDIDTNKQRKTLRTIAESPQQKPP